MFLSQPGIYICINIYIYIYISTNITQQWHIKIQLYFDSYKSSTDWQWGEKCKNYIQLDQLKKIKRQRVDWKEKWKCYKTKANNCLCASKTKECWKLKI